MIPRLKLFEELIVPNFEDSRNSSKMNLKIISLIFLVSVAACSAPDKKKEQKSQQQAVNEQRNIDQKKILMFFGNSITAGYGIALEESFPSVIQNWIDSLDYPYQVVNAGLSGETTAGGLNRIDWVLQTVPDVFVLELGANDGLRGLDLEESEKNLIAIVNKVKKVNPVALIFIASMEVPPNLGVDYTSKFRSIFPAAANATEAQLIPFILDGVGGNPELNQDDGIHPTAKGAKVVAKNVWEYLEPHLKK